MNMLRKCIRNNRHLLKYSFIGGTGVVLDFVSFAALTHALLLPYLPANAISVSLGITNNFFLNAFYNFHTRDRLLCRFIRFYSIGLLGLLISSVIMFILVNLISLNALSAKLITIVIVAVLQFYLNKTITFKNTEIQSTNG
jgi:putative flippase GtrA